MGTELHLARPSWIVYSDNETMKNLIVRCLVFRYSTLAPGLQCFADIRRPSPNSTKSNLQVLSYAVATAPCHFAAWKPVVARAFVTRLRSIGNHALLASSIVLESWSLS